MAKKGTTGGPRSRRTTAEDLRRRREYKSHAERDRMWQRRVLFVTVGLIALSLIVLAIAVINEQVLVPRQAITTVNGDEISTRDYQARVRFTRWLTAEQIRSLYYLTGGNIETIQQYASDQLTNLQRPILMGSQVLDEMEEELVLKQGADEMGITVDDAVIDQQVDEYMAQRVGLVAPGSNTPTPTTEPSVTPTPLVSPTPSNTPRPTATSTPLPTATPPVDEQGTPLPTATEPVDEEGNPLPTSTPTAEPSPTLSPTPTATLEPDKIQATLEQEADDWYGDATDASEVSRDTIREMFYYDALRTAVRDRLAEDVPTEELQVNARHMLFAFNPENASDPTPPTDEQKAAALQRAEDALQALQDGEPFANLATVVSNDTGSGANGGELGWASPDNYVDNFKDTVLNATIGEIVGPIETEFGYHIIQVHEREIRELSASELSSRQQEAYQTWLNERLGEANISRHDDWLDRIPETPSYNTLLGDILPVQ